MCTLSAWLCIPVSRHRRISGVIIFCLVSWDRISHWTWRSLFNQLGWWTASPSDQSSFVPVPSIGVTGIHGHTDLSECCGYKIVSPCLLNKSVLTYWTISPDLYIKIWCWKACAIKSFILHMVKERSNSHKLFSDLNVHSVACTCLYTPHPLKCN